MGVREFSCVLCAVLFSGCAADYLNHYDTVTLAAGDAAMQICSSKQSTRSIRTVGTRISRATACALRQSSIGIEGCRQHRRNRHGRAAVIWIAQAARETMLSWLAR